MYLDTRDLWTEANDLAGGDWENPDADVLAELDEDDRERLDALTAVLGEIGNEARYGETMIPEHDFEEYAQDLAEDIGAIGRDNQWPLYCIDWKHAARELAMDYTSVDLDGTTYLVRTS